MIVDLALAQDIRDIPRVMPVVQDLGFAGVWRAETVEDPLFPLMLCGEHSHLDLVAATSVAFARTPMQLAYELASVRRFTDNRLIAGLGSQVRPHITKRFNMPWNRPVDRMRDFIGALRAIWGSWTTGGPLAYRGPFYRHTYMPDFNRPRLLPDDRLEVHLAGVGPMMTALAGELADGYLLHALAHPAYIEDHALPALRSGLQRVGRSRDDITVASRILMATGFSEEDLAVGDLYVRAELGFHGSTAAYRQLFENAGYGPVHDDLRRLARRGDLAQMMRALPDEMVETFAVVAPIADVPGLVERRFGPVLDRIAITLPDHALQPEHLDDVAALVSSLKSIRRQHSLGVGHDVR